MKTWQVMDVVVTNDACEAAEYGLMEAGASGTETVDACNGCVIISGYFAGAEQIDAARTSVAEALRIYGCPPSALFETRIREIEEQDWLAEWKKHWQPVQVGRFIITPPWIAEPAALAGGPADAPTIIRVNPGMAFGTGTHETTRLCLKAIEKYFSGGSFLDVGTGTGILAIAAAKVNVEAQITACDTDAAAVAIARENAELNGVDDRIDFRVGTIDESMSSADMVCANLTAPVIVELLPSLLNVTCGRLILSGILDAQFEMVHARLVELAATVNEINQDGEWLALVI